jgi:tRNA 5-methylaminomethyl-2-thiouridine biosynthesis bifunctional protein
VAIIGAGIAGASCARALVRRGVECIVLECAGEIASGASGNPAGIVMPRLDRDGPLREFFLAAYIDAVRAYDALRDEVFTGCGVEEASDGEALADLLADPPLPEDWFRGLANGAAWHARAGLVRPRAVIEAFLRGADVRCGVEVSAIETSDAGVRLRTSAGDIEADAIIIAAGATLAHFPQSRFIPIELSRGQIEWGQGVAPAHVHTHGSYAAPFDGGVLFGATFDRDESDKASARARNIAALTALAPHVAASLDARTLHSRASWRATTPDRAPVAGLLPNTEAWLAQYADIAHGREPDTSALPSAHRGVYVIGGLGARGLTFAPLLGERLASEICGEPQILQQDALDALHPARFLHRALKRKLTPRLG